jgi:hypothetical protein
MKGPAMFRKIRDAFKMAMFLFTFLYALTGLVRLAVDSVKELVFQIRRRFNPNLTRTHI